MNEIKKKLNECIKELRELWLKDDEELVEAKINQQKELLDMALLILQYENAKGYCALNHILIRHDGYCPESAPPKPCSPKCIAYVNLILDEEAEP